MKPGKPKYNIPKAYRPIALLNTLTKLLSTIVVEEITHLVESTSSCWQTILAEGWGRPPQTHGTASGPC